MKSDLGTVTVYLAVTPNRPGLTCADARFLVGEETGLLSIYRGAMPIACFASGVWSHVELRDATAPDSKPEAIAEAA